MGEYIDDTKLVIITELRSICFDLTRKADNSLKYENDILSTKF